MPDGKNVVSTLEEIKTQTAGIGLDSAVIVHTFIDKIIALLKEQQQRIEQLEIDRDILVKDINTNNCNTCKRECEHRPRPGDVVRVNCFMWEGR